MGYYSSSRLFSELQIGKTDGSYLKIIKRIIKHNVLIIGDPTIADAIMDRIVYNSHRIELQGESVKRKMYAID